MILPRASTALATALACATAACSTTGRGGDASTEENDFLKNRSEQDAVAEKMFGLDYTTDPETGQTTSGRKFDIGERDFSRGDSQFSRSAGGTQKTFETGSFSGSGAGDAQERFGAKKFSTANSRYGGRSSRFSEKRARDGDSTYRDASRAVPADPYRESSKLMRAGDYRPSADAQAENIRASDYPQRTQQPGDPVPNYRSEELSIDDVQGLLNKGAQ